MTTSATGRPGRRLSTRLHSLLRWLHIYMSLLGLAVTLFFGVTGLTLNHPHWFDSGYEAVREDSCEFHRELSANPESHRLEIVEFARSRFDIQAPLRDLQIDDFQITLAFAGPGYTSDVRIDRETSFCEFSEIRLGIVAVINDLHKGRDTGGLWSVVIDVSAILLVLISLTGTALLVWLKRRWRSGLVTIAIGGFLTAAVIWLTVVL
ncbi:MAG: PepSY-associated TM helix domain-containing protein [Planctomycetaceae bacterium]|nr:PepSY-associated TM helix domain-containing protein [Planctomycetaceae bacterium]